MIRSEWNETAKQYGERQEAAKRLEARRERRRQVMLATHTGTKFADQNKREGVVR